MSEFPEMLDDAEPERRRRSESGWERHIQSVLGAILVALIWWVGSSVQSQSIAIAQLQVTVSALSTQMAAQISQQQRAVPFSQEAADIARLQAEDDALRGRVRRVEEAIPHRSGGRQ